MKKNLLRFTLLVMVGSLIMASSSCKKGENDPAISLRSRTARLAGEWELSSENYTHIYNNDGYSSTSKHSYDGSIRTVISTDSYGGTSSTSTSTSAYTEKLTINKDGSFTREEISGTTKRVYEGNWMWVKGNDNQGLKNRQTVLFSTTRYTRTSDGSVYVETTSGKTNFDDFFVIDRLASNEMVILLDSKSTDSDGGTSTSSGTVTYTQK